MSTIVSRDLEWSFLMAAMLRFVTLVLVEGIARSTGVNPGGDGGGHASPTFWIRGDEYLIIPLTF